ncbi:MAG: helicase domain-containing protein [bacterium P3]|nr:MAG: helicase domain-containing protein [bacterium P3]KWW41978.1 MAG: Uncharacterized protein F083_629 [bacterium F083]
MADFSINDCVRNVMTQKTGRIVHVYERRRGQQLYRVFYSQDEEEDESERDLERHVVVNDLFDRCIIGDYQGYRDFQINNTTFKIQNSNNNTLSSIKASKTIFKTYQYIPLMKFLNSDTQHLLIADEVGLGKTIEAGHILLEMKARGELKNVLVVCPKSLTTKWKDELLERFGLTFSIFDDKKAMREDLDSHNGNSRGIITYDSVTDRLHKGDIKPEELTGLTPREISRLKERKREVIRKDSRRSVLQYMEEKGLRYSIVICDEAHKVRNTGSTNKDIKRLLKLSTAAVFLTATPMMTGRDNLFHLLNLLNEQRYPYESAFSEEMEHNKPVVRAVSMLGAGVPLMEIRQFLQSSYPEDNYVWNDELFLHIMDQLGQPESARLRMLVQSDLYALNSTGRIMTRTRKVDVTTDLSQATRDTQAIAVELYPDEQRLFDRYMDEADLMDPLPATTRKMQVASSVYGFRNSGSAPMGIADAKVEALMHILRQTEKKGIGKVIVFAQFHDTLDYLALQLDRRHIKYRHISGHQAREERVEAVDDFRDKIDVRVLLSTEVGGEGLDLQFCDTVVNYDLPWNPMVVEQRIGRVDRIGQRSPVVHIYNLVVKGSIQQRVYNRLLTRIEAFRQTVGDLEPILGGQFDANSTIEDAIDDLYRTKLTDAELEEKMIAVEQAMQRNLYNSELLNRELQESFTSDAYFRNNLNKIIHNQSYVTEQELENYVRGLFSHELPTCNVGPVVDGIVTISTPQNNTKEVSNFLLRYSTLVGEKGVIMSEFAAKVRDKQQFEVTFSQEVAERNRNVTYLNIYHPLVVAAKESYLKSYNPTDQTFRFHIHRDESDRQMPDSGYYIMALYNVSTRQQRYGTTRNRQEILPVVYSIQKGDILEDEESVESLRRAVQNEGKPWTAEDRYVIDDGTVADMRVAIKEHVRECCDRQLNEVLMRQNSDVQNQRFFLAQRYNNEIEQLEARIESHEDEVKRCQLGLWFDEFDNGKSIEDRMRDLQRVMPAERSLLQSRIDERDAKLHELDHVPQPVVSSKLMMINLIHIL